MGVVALILLVVLVTNGVRRRRARKFDKELQAATLEAASAPKPMFLDDDEDDAGYNRSGSGPTGHGAYGGGGAFSDVSSHGTYNQPAMSAESYGMREMGYPPPPAGPPVGPGEIYDPYGSGGVGVASGAAAAGAAGIGVARARSMRSDNAAMGLQEGATPYAAFAAPGSYGQHTPPVPAVPGDYHQRNVDLLEAAGMGAHVAGAAMLARNQSQAMQHGQDQYYQQQQQQYGAQGQYSTQQELHRRSPSQTQAQTEEFDPLSASTGVTQYYSPANDNYYGQAMPQAQAYSHYQNVQTSSSQSQQQQQYPYQEHTQYQEQHKRGYSTATGASGMETEDMDDAYGGYVVDSNYHDQPGSGGGPVLEPALPSGHAKRLSGNPDSSDGDGRRTNTASERESRYGSDEEEEEERPKRVLKVANE